MTQVIKVDKPNPHIIKVDKPNPNNVIRVNKPNPRKVIKVDKPSPEKFFDDKVAEAASKITGISELTFWDKQRDAASRRMNLIGNALIGDVPFVRKIIPEGARKIVPIGKIDKAVYAIPKLARDIKAVSGVTALKGLRFLGGAGLYGAATAGTEDPKEIAIEAAKTAALFKTIDIGFRHGPKAAQRIWEKAVHPKIKSVFNEIGQSMGTVLKKSGQFAALKFKRYADLKLGVIEGEKFAMSLDKLPKVEREALTFMMEGSGIPKKLGRPDITAVLKNTTKRKQLQGVAHKMRRVYNAYHKELVETYGDDIGFVRGYINRLWDIPRAKQDNVAKWFMTRSKHADTRLIKTIQEGVNKFGLKPKTLDAAELFRYYNSNVHKAIANFRFVNGIKQLKSADNVPLIQKANKAPQDWPIFDHPILRRVMGHKVKGELKKTKIPVRVHPDILDEMKTVFGSKSEHQIVKAIEGINAFAKYSQLSLSLFHHVALTESAIATGIFNPKMMATTIRAMMRGERPILNDPSAKEWIKAGMNVGAPTDIHRNLLEGYLLQAENNLKKRALTKPFAWGVKAIRKPIELNNRFLWDYYHPQLKLLSANKMYKDALKMPKWANKPQYMVKQEVAQFVNDSFGGQAFELMTKSPQWQQGMHLTLLSPDWTLSTIRQALAPFGVGARHEATKDLRAMLGQNFWRAGGLILFSSMNQMNRAMTKFYLGESRDMWENDPGKETQVFIGKNTDGTNAYLRGGKQFRELPEYFVKNGRFNPLGASFKKIEGKLSPIVGMGLEQKFPWQYGELAKAMGTKREGRERAKQLGKSFLPFSVQRQMGQTGMDFSPINLAFPINKGLTYYKTLNMYKEAFSNRDMKMVDRIFKSAAENGLPARKIMDSAIRDIEYEESGGYKKANEIFIELQKIPVPNWREHIQQRAPDEKTQKRLRTIINDKVEAQEILKRLK